MNVEQMKAALAARKPVTATVSSWEEAGAIHGEMVGNAVADAMEVGDKTLTYLGNLWTATRYTLAVRKGEITPE